MAVYIYVQHRNATPSVEGKSLGTFRRGAEGLGLLFWKGEAKNNGSRRGLDCKVRNSALTEREGRTGLNQDERHSKEKKEKGKQTYSGNAELFGGWAGTRSGINPVVLNISAEQSSGLVCSLVFFQQPKWKGHGTLDSSASWSADTFSA